MLRITQYLRELAQAQATGVYPAAARRGGGTTSRGPVVIWNLIRQEVFDVMDDLRRANVPALILSGGEPLLRPDFFTLAQRSKDLGFHTSLSSNGTLIDEPMADAIAALGFDYVGVSLDGLKATHDRFRRLDGAFERSLAGVRFLRDRGIKVGLRYTMTALNAHDFPALLELMREEGAHKFYFSHLNYAGRGNTHRSKDTHHQATRAAMDLLLDRAWPAAVDGLDEEYVSGNNDADGPYLLQWLQMRMPELHARFGATLRQRLVDWGGNASGVNVANIDNLGHVHPDTMWWHHDLGSVRERAFADIWHDTSDPLMAGLKARPRRVGGRCGQCAHLDICNGNTRVRAQQLTGDPWAEDPGCYLDDAEIGLQPAANAQQATRGAARVIRLVEVQGA